MRPYKIVATSKTHDFLEDDEIVVRMTPQKMFPNCQKYTICCKDDLFEFKQFMTMIENTTHIRNKLSIVNPVHVSSTLTDNTKKQEKEPVEFTGY